MQGPRETHMDGPCDICGGLTDKDIVAYPELIATCSKCKIAREHVYCMQILRLELPENWVCESCVQGNDLISPKSAGREDTLRSSPSPRRIRDVSGWQAHSRRQNPIKISKVKPLSYEEVIRLRSGTEKMRPPLQSTSRSKPGQLPSGLVKPPMRDRTCKMKSISEINQQAYLILEDQKEPKAPATQNSKEYGSNDHLVAATLPSKEVKPSKLSLQKETKTLVASGKEQVWKKQPMDVLVPAIDKTSNRKIKDSLAVPTGRHFSPISSPGSNTPVVAEHKHSDGEVRDLLNICPSLNLYRSYLPALQVTWKGDFIIRDEAAPISGFQAQPPCRVHQKAFEFSQNLPSILHVDMLPRSPIWADLFQDECPIQEVALYFLPADNIDGSRDNLAHLFEEMETKELMLKSCIDGVELLIFTSRQLHFGAQKAVLSSSKTQNFLWGVFRPTNKCQAHHKEIDNMEVDMEIDMVGGIWKDDGKL